MAKENYYEQSLDAMLDYDVKTKKKEQRETHLGS